ncbi:MAG: DarT ssDNA thymidine ADP-ribosyltransferase family protein [candidate division KSB1 bacterium]|nr:DarT ssDNA thymidine ADP-ribosyltransferase family protein [candidate division KSB1 bacterium]
MVDFAVMKEIYWHNTPDDPDRKERRQAEFLVFRFFPWNIVTQIAVLNENIAQKVESILETSEYKPAVKLKPEWYYRF